MVDTTNGMSIIAGLDMLILPYKVEPFGRVLLEAWLSNTPVVATNVGKIDKIITDCKDGLLVYYGNEEAMKYAVIKLWREKKFRDSIIREGKNTVESRFNINKSVSALEFLYMKAVGLSQNRKV